MNSTLRSFGILAAAALILLVGAALAVHNHLVSVPALLLQASGIAVMFGVVTVNYVFPVGTPLATDPPAAPHAANLVVADVIAAADGDVAATIIHNMALSAADLANAFPLVAVEDLTAFAALKVWREDVAARTANQIVLAATGAGGSGDAAAQIRVSIARPHSITQ